MPVGYVVPVSLIGLPPPTLSSIVGDIHPLLAVIHEWCDSGTVPLGGAGATTTGDSTVVCCCTPYPMAWYVVDAVRLAVPGAAPAGSLTVNTKSACLPPASRTGALDNGFTVHPVPPATETVGCVTGSRPSLRTLTCTVSSSPPATTGATPSGCASVPTFVTCGMPAVTCGIPGTPVAGSTRNSAVPCAGTAALMTPALSVTLFVHAFFSVNRSSPLRPTAAAVVVSVRALSPRFSSTTARLPSASRFTQVSVVPAAPTRTACTAALSWLIAITSGSVSIPTVVALSFRTSLPTTSGAAASAHSVSWVRNSSSVMPSSGAR